MERRRDLLSYARTCAALNAPFFENDGGVSFYTPSVSAKRKIYALASKCGARVFSKSTQLLGWPYYYMRVMF